MRSMSADRNNPIIQAYCQEPSRSLDAEGGGGRVLVVGAGGIGCEVLKNLVMCGILNIDVIDLDTIDVSNLNRQFLFRPEHVGQPKSIVAAKAALDFNPDAKITAFHGNINESRFDISYFKQFKLVLNALDNVGARRHVNRMCLIANVPLLESGTTGYVGQATPIIKNYTECYECRPITTQKVYPICTIRSTPDKPVHCIVWAKELFKLLFGNKQESMLFEDPNGPEKSVYMEYISFPYSTGIDNVLQTIELLLKALFNEEIHNKISMGTYKTSTCSPLPFDNELISKICVSARSIVSGSGGAWPSSKKQWDRAVWNTEESFLEFIHCIYELYDKTPENFDHTMIGSLSFDKDDKWSMRFITAASNLRSIIFSIPSQTFHDAKGIAGNIIPAIASTNAIIAGLQVAEALKILSTPSNTPADYVGRLRSTYCFRTPTRKGYYLQPTIPDPRSNQCYVCGQSQRVLSIDTHRRKLSFVVENVLTKELGFVEPAVMIGATVIYDVEDEDISKRNLGKNLIDLPGGGIKDGVVVHLEDMRQELRVQLFIQHVNTLDEEKFPQGFILSNISEVSKSVSAVNSEIVCSDKSSDKRKSDNDHEMLTEEGHSFKKQKADDSHEE